jgi:hypothetical protein
MSSRMTHPLRPFLSRNYRRSPRIVLGPFKRHGRRRDGRRVPTTSDSLAYLLTTFKMPTAGFRPVIWANEITLMTRLPRRPWTQAV